jgi:hypothetical protein
MIRSRFVRSFALVLSAAVALSCADIAPTAPLAPDTAQYGLLSGLLGTVTGLIGNVLKIIVAVVDPTNGVKVSAVKWAPNHDNQEHTASGTIGFNGGTLSIPASDFTITFPRGALAGPTAIKITSDLSGYVSYDMEPHGTVFAKPVIVTQKLRNTSVYGTPEAWNVRGAYFPVAPPILTGILKADETTTSVILASPSGGGQPEIVTWALRHFSRYMLASG